MLGYKWVLKCKPIPLATVPILKLEIDPSIPFDSYTMQHPPLLIPHFWDMSSQKVQSHVFQVDITFETMPMDY
jgi:hypothetical protein